jgi:stearoyl-CoA desaturase (Delta-9 desaturase)
VPAAEAAAAIKQPQTDRTTWPVGAPGLAGSNDSSVIEVPPGELTPRRPRRLGVLFGSAYDEDRETAAIVGKLQEPVAESRRRRQCGRRVWRLASVGMTRLERNVNITAVVLPFLVVAASVPLLWGRLIGPSDVIVFAVMYVVCGLAVTVGYHRMLTHRAFQAHPATRYVFAVLGSMAIQGPVIEWVADHRKHHAHTDKEGDPHSPHVGHGAGVRGALRGLWHAHVGWLWRTNGQARTYKYARELVEDRGMKRINRAFPQLVLLSLALPALLGLALTGTLRGALTGLLWGGFARIFVQHHVTWSVNSICHFFGTRRFAVDDESTNVFWLALPSFGESWHHNHHAFPRSAAHGLRWWEVDPSELVIRLMRRLGLAWDVVLIPPARQQQKLTAAPATPASPAAPG